MPDTSIIIRAFNEERHLPELFDALDQQTYRDFEALVVDSGSFDRTAEIARARADRVVQIQPQDFTFGYSLNAGIRQARGSQLIIVSAHAIPTSREWLGRLVGALRQPNVAMVYGRQIGRRESQYSECRDFYRTYGAERRLLQPPHFFANNANSAIRQELWRDHEFDEFLPGLEDIEWAKFWMERGWQVAYEPEANVYHVHTETWRQVRRRYYREGVAAKAIGVRGRRNIPTELAQAAGDLSSDAWAAWREGKLFSLAGDIVRFRMAKAVGGIHGLWDGAALQDPTRRDSLLFDRRYQAAVIHGPGRIALETRELKPLKPTEVMVRVAYQGICATDIEVLDGVLGYYKHGIAQYPIVPGHEFSATVAAVGARVQDFSLGDPVVVECIQGCGDCPSCRNENPIGCAARSEVGVIGRDGGYAEYVVTPARFVHRLPAALSLRDACLCEPVAVVLKGLRRLQQSHGGEIGRVAIVGAGPIGHLAARILARHPCQVTVFDRDPDRLRQLEGGRIAVSNELDALEGFETAIEATGDPLALERMLHLSGAGTTLLLLGLPYAKREFSFESVVCQDKTIVGSVGSAARDFGQALQVLPLIDTSAFFQNIFPLSELDQALAMARSRRFLKIVLRPDSRSAMAAAAPSTGL